MAGGVLAAVMAMPVISTDRSDPVGDQAQVASWSTPQVPNGRMPLYSNPALFDLVHRGYRGDVDWYRSTIGYASSLVIDLGCGTGRLALPLAGDGHRVIAIDDSEEMVEVLRQQITPALAIGVLAADVRQVLLTVQADVVVASCNFLGHFTPDERQGLLRRIAQWLTPAGRLLIDVADAAWHRQHPYLHRSVPFQMDHGSMVVFEANSKCTGAAIDIGFAIRSASAATAPERANDVLVRGDVTLHLIEDEALRTDLAQAGFTVEQWSHDFGASDTEPTGSRVVVVATLAHDPRARSSSTGQDVFNPSLRNVKQ